VTDSHLVSLPKQEAWKLSLHLEMETDLSINQALVSHIPAVDGTLSCPKLEDFLQHLSKAEKEPSSSKPSQLLFLLLWGQLEEALNQPRDEDRAGHTLQLSFPASPALGTFLTTHPTAFTAAAQLTKWVETLLWQPGFVPAQHVCVPNLLCLPDNLSSFTYWVQAAQEEG